jgi:hypothetical protein
MFGLSYHRHAIVLPIDSALIDASPHAAMLALKYWLAIVVELTAQEYRGRRVGPSATLAVVRRTNPTEGGERRGGAGRDRPWRASD